LIYIDSSMGRNGFQSINLSISDSLSPAAIKRSYSVFQGEITESTHITKFILIEYKYCCLVWVRGGVNQKSLRTILSLNSSTTLYYFSFSFRNQKPF
jgi:hypothetical protein